MDFALKRTVFTQSYLWTGIDELSGFVKTQFLKQAIFRRVQKISW